MRKSMPTKCGKCGGKTKPFTMFANASTGETHFMCANCMANRTAEQVDDLAEIDDLIAEHEEMISKLEDMVKESEDMDIPPELEAFAFTPMKSYKMAQMTLATLKSKRLALLKHGENEERLQYELDKKIEEENYKEAGAIKKRMDALKAVPKEKKKRNEKQATEQLSQLFDSGEDEGKCVRCNDRFPKPPGLFNGFDIGDCHEMCLPCCVLEVPKHVKTVKMADQMIAEVEKFSGMMDSMSIFSKMLTGELNMENIEMGEEEDVQSIIQRLKGNEREQRQTEGQEASGMMLKVLKMKRDFLARTNEDEGMTEAADLLSNLIQTVFGDTAIADLKSFPGSIGDDTKAAKNKGKRKKGKPKKGRKRKKK